MRKAEASEFNETRRSSSHHFFNKLKTHLAPENTTAFIGTRAPPICRAAEGGTQSRSDHNLHIMEVTSPLALCFLIAFAHVSWLAISSSAPAHFCVRSVGAFQGASAMTTLALLTALTVHHHAVKPIDWGPSLYAVGLHLALQLLWSSVSNGPAPFAREPPTGSHVPVPKAPPATPPRPPRRNRVGATTRDANEDTTAEAPKTPQSPWEKVMAHAARAVQKMGFNPPSGSTSIFMGNGNNTGTNSVIFGAGSHLPSSYTAQHNPATVPYAAPTPASCLPAEEDGPPRRAPAPPPAEPTSHVPPSLPAATTTNGGNRGTSNAPAATHAPSGPRLVAEIVATGDALHLVPTKAKEPLPTGFVGIKSSTLETEAKRPGLTAILKALTAFGALCYTRSTYTERAGLLTLGRNLCPPAALLLSLGFDDYSTSNMKILFTSLIAVAQALSALSQDDLLKIVACARSFTSPARDLKCTEMPNRPHFGIPYAESLKSSLRNFITNYAYITSCAGDFTRVGPFPADSGDIDILMFLLCICLKGITFGVAIASLHPDGKHNLTTHASLGYAGFNLQSSICYTTGHFTAAFPSNALHKVRGKTFDPSPVHLLIAQRLLQVTSTSHAAAIIQSILRKPGGYEVFKSTPSSPSPATEEVINVEDDSVASSPASSSDSTYNTSSSASSGAEPLEPLGDDETTSPPSEPLPPRRGGASRAQPTATATQPTATATQPSATPNAQTSEAPQTPAPDASARAPASKVPMPRGLNLAPSAPQAPAPQPRPPAQARGRSLGPRLPYSAASAAPLQRTMRSSSRIATAAPKAAAAKIVSS